MRRFEAHSSGSSTQASRDCSVFGRVPAARIISHIHFVSLFSYLRRILYDVFRSDASEEEIENFQDECIKGVEERVRRVGGKEQEKLKGLDLLKRTDKFALW